MIIVDEEDPVGGKWKFVYCLAHHHALALSSSLHQSLFVSLSLSTAEKRAKRFDSN